MKAGEWAYEQTSSLPPTRGPLFLVAVLHVTEFCVSHTAYELGAVVFFSGLVHSLWVVGDELLKGWGRGSSVVSAGRGSD